MQGHVAHGRNNREDDDTVTVNGALASGPDQSVAPRLAVLRTSLSGDRARQGGTSRVSVGFKAATLGKGQTVAASLEGASGHDAGADSSGEQESSRGQEHSQDEEAGARRLKRLRAP